MNIAAALKQLNAQIKAENLEVHQYTLFNGSVQVILLSSNELPSRPILARGIAIKSPTDEPSEEGEVWAKKRALHAYQNRVTTDPIWEAWGKATKRPRHPKGAALETRLQDTIAAFYGPFRTKRKWRAGFYEGKPMLYKSQYSPALPEWGKARRVESAILERLNREALGQEVKP